MPLTGLQIFKLLPNTNCKKCGYPTCLTFAMKLAAGKETLEKCPDASPEAKAALGAASAPPIRGVTIGRGERALTIGEETVFFRHEKTFVRRPGLFQTFDPSGLTAAERDARLDHWRAVRIDRAGETFRVDGIAVVESPAAPGSAVDAASSAERSFQSVFSAGAAPCAGMAAGAPTCPLAVSLNTFPSGRLKTPSYYQYNIGIEQQVGAHGAARVDYVGTRGVHEPYQVELNGYQTVCAGCFAPYAYKRPLDQRFGSVNEFQTGANSSYSGLQASIDEQIGSLTLRGNYTFSHCLDEVSNGGLLSFSSQGILSPLPGELRRQHGNCDYDVRHNISAFGIYQIPFRSSHALLRAVLGGWSYSETAFFHSGLPFSVLSQPYTANGNGIFQGSGPQFARRVPGVPLYRKTDYGGVTVAGTRQWLNPDAFVSVVDPTTGACTGGDSAANCQFGDTGRNTVRGPHFTDSDVYVTKRFSLAEGKSLRFDVEMFNAFNHPNFALPGNVEAGVPGVYIPAKFGTLEGTTSPPTGLLGVGLGGDSSPRMIAFQARVEF